MVSSFASLPLWLSDLPSEDLEFLKRFILTSGSLKDLAKLYGISYPTVRLRLDRVIARIRSSEAVQDSDPMTRKIRSLLADGSLDASVGKQLLTTYAAVKKETL